MHISSLHYIHTHTLTVGWEISSGSLLSVLQWHDIEGALSSATYDISIHVCFQLFVIIRKIRIGYIINSDDVRTLVFSRYSENPSHTHLHIYPQTSMHLCALPHTPAHTSNHPLTPAHTSTHLSTPAHTSTRPHTPDHTCAQPTYTRQCP